MLVNISDINPSVAFPFSCKKEVLLPSDLNLTKNTAIVCFDGEFLRQADVYCLSGKVKTVLNCLCDRCLKEMIIDIEFDICEEFCSDEKNIEDVWEFTGKFINIEEAIIMNILLNIPVKFICKDDCKGLCQKCGKNLNDGNCGCGNNIGNNQINDFLDLLNEDREV